MASWFVEAKEWYARQHPAVKVLLVLGGGAAAVGVGVLAAPAVGAAASAAGLGVAGGTFSGAAASSAGLAALGGGSIASGGLGMAGGTALVGTISGVAGTAAAARASTTVSKDGARSAELAKQARRQEVEDDGIRMEVG